MQPPAPLLFEERKLRAEMRMRREELAVTREVELAKLAGNPKHSPLGVPVMVAIVGGLLTLVTSVITNHMQASQANQTQERKFQSDLIQKAIERGKTNEDAAVNLMFLAKAGLIPLYPDIEELVDESDVLPQGNKVQIPSAQTFAAVIEPPPTAELADSLIRVGSWNIERLGGNLGRGDAESRARSIAEHILLSGVDVLAIQEVADTDGGDEKLSNEHLDKALALLNQLPNQRWRYVLFPSSMGNQIATGVAWNSAVLRLASEPYRLPIDRDAVEDGRRLWMRHPYAAKFATDGGKTDFVLICIHMRSNFGGGPAAQELRAREAAVLAATLEEVRKTLDDEDVIVLGDTNGLNADEPAFRTLKEAGFRDLNAEDTTTYVGMGNGLEAPFDRIFVTDAQPEFQKSRQYVLQACDPKAHDNELSDHLLVLTSVAVMPDDD